MRQEGFIHGAVRARTLTIEKNPHYGRGGWGTRAWLANFCFSSADDSDSADRQGGHQPRRSLLTIARKCCGGAAARGGGSRNASEMAGICFRNQKELVGARMLGLRWRAWVVRFCHGPRHMVRERDKNAGGLSGGVAELQADGKPRCRLQMLVNRPHPSDVL